MILVCPINIFKGDKDAYDLLNYLEIVPAHFSDLLTCPFSLPMDTTLLLWGLSSPSLRPQSRLKNSILLLTPLEWVMDVPVFTLRGNRAK